MVIIMKKSSKHSWMSGFMAGILIISLILSCTGCASSQSAAAPTSAVESAPITAQPVESTEVPVETAAPSSSVEVPEPSYPVKAPPAEPAAAASPAPTSGSTHEVPQATKGLPSIAKIDEKTIVEIGSDVVYNFRNKTYAGCGLDGTVRPFEMYYGIYAETKGSKLTYRAYSHVKDVKPVSATITRNTSGTTRRLQISTTDTTIDLVNQSNGAFTIAVKFSTGYTCYVTAYVNDKEAWLTDIAKNCDAEIVQEIAYDRADALQAFAAKWGVTPENSLGVTVKDIAYPTYAGRGPKYRCDTELWAALAHDIVPDDTLGDTVKLTLLHDWMTANLSYPVGHRWRDHGNAGPFCVAHLDYRYDRSGRRPDERHWLCLFHGNSGSCHPYDFCDSDRRYLRTDQDHSPFRGQRGIPGAAYISSGTAPNRPHGGRNVPVR